MFVVNSSYPDTSRLRYSMILMSIVTIVFDYFSSMSRKDESSAKHMGECTEPCGTPAL